MGLDVRQDDFDGSTKIFSRPVPSAALAERSGQTVDGGTDLSQAGHGVGRIHLLPFLGQAESAPEFIEKRGPRGQSFGDGSEGRRAALDGPQNPAQPVESLVDLGIVRRVFQECFDGARSPQAAVVQPKPREIEGKSLAVSLRWIVQDPLSHAADDGDSGGTCRYAVSLRSAGLPLEKTRACLADVATEFAAQVASQFAAQVASQFAQLSTQPSLAKEPTQLVVPILKQILADVAQEMEMAGQHRDGRLEILHQRLGRFRHSPAQVSHDRARRAEAEHNFAQPGKNDVSPFGGHFPGANVLSTLAPQHPLPPTGEGYQQCAFKFLRQACRGRPRP